MTTNVRASLLAVAAAALTASFVGACERRSGDEGARDAGADAAAPPVELATGLTTPLGLTVEGCCLYWVSGRGEDGGAIFSLPVSGGVPSIVYASPTLQGGLATDGELLYFTAGDPLSDAGVEIDSVAFDGGGAHTLAAGLTVFGTRAVQPSPLWASDGALYFAGVSANGDGVGSVYALSTDGGVPAELLDVPWGGEVTGREVSELLWVDSSGLYFSFQPEDGGGTYAFGTTPRSGGPPTLLALEASGTGVGGAGWQGDFVVDGKGAYFVEGTPSPPVPDAGTALGRIALPSGAMTSVASYPAEQAFLNEIVLVGDSSGLYEIQSQGEGAGIYRIDPATGAQQLLAGDVSKGAPFPAMNLALPAALDAKYVYFTEVTDTGYSLWALTR